MSESQGSFSQLQHLLKLSYSDDPAQQQSAAMELSKLIEGTFFPSVSFGPLAHALCRLVPNENRTVSSYASRALKMLILDDALRPQAITAGVPGIVCAAIAKWEDEALCLQELLGSLQTLCWDKACVRHVLACDIVDQLMEYIQATDQEVSILALASIANILSFSDTILLTEKVVVEKISRGMPMVLDALKCSQQRPQRFYAAAAVANASAHPRLAAELKAAGALAVVQEVERQSLANLHILGSKLGDCARTAVYKLSDGREGEAKMGLARYSFKWGTKPVMELSLAVYKNSTTLWVCLGIWVVVVLVTFLPIVFA